MSIEVTDFVRVKDKAPLIGLASFYIPKLKLHLRECKIIQKFDGDFYVAYPSKKMGINYTFLFCFEEDMNIRFQESAKKAIHSYVNANKDIRESQLNLFK